MYLCLCACKHMHVHDKGLLLPGGGYTPVSIFNKVSLLVYLHTAALT